MVHWYKGTGTIECDLCGRDATTDNINRSPDDFAEELGWALVSVSIPETGETFSLTICKDCIAAKRELWER